MNHGSSGTCLQKQLVCTTDTRPRLIHMRCIAVAINRRWLSWFDLGGLFRNQKKGCVSVWVRVYWWFVVVYSLYSLLPNVVAPSAPSARWCCSLPGVTPPARLSAPSSHKDSSIVWPSTHQRKTFGKAALRPASDSLPPSCFYFRALSYVMLFPKQLLLIVGGEVRVGAGLWNAHTTDYIY